MITKYDLGFSNGSTYEQDHEVFVKLFETLPYFVHIEYIVFENFYIYKDGQYRFIIKRNNFSIIYFIDYNYIQLEDKRDVIRNVISNNKLIPIRELPKIFDKEEYIIILAETIRKQKLKKLLDI